MGMYDIDNIKIDSIIRVTSECDEGKTIKYNGYCYPYQLIYCLSGEGNVLFQNIKMKDKPRTIRYLPRHIENNIYLVENIHTCDYIDICFSTDTPLPETAFVNDYSANTKLEQLFVKIHNIWSKKEPGHYTKCIALFFSILYEMQISDLKLYHKSYMEKISAGVDYIHNHYCDCEFKYNHLSALCNISYTYFKELFRKIYNTTPSEYIKSLKIKKATELLLTQHFSVRQIAEMCGYENIYYFSKVFKGTIGVPPSEYTKYINKI